MDVIPAAELIVSPRMIPFRQQRGGAVPAAIARPRRRTAAVHQPEPAAGAAYAQGLVETQPSHELAPGPVAQAALVAQLQEAALADQLELAVADGCHVRHQFLQVV